MSPSQPSPGRRAWVEACLGDVRRLRGTWPLTRADTAAWRRWRAERVAALRRVEADSEVQLSVGFTDGTKQFSQSKGTTTS